MREKLIIISIINAFWLSFLNIVEPADSSLPNRGHSCPLRDPYFHLRNMHKKGGSIAWVLYNLSPINHLFLLVEKERKKEKEKKEEEKKRRKSRTCRVIGSNNFVSSRRK